jgi:hypothetical protein
LRVQGGEQVGGAVALVVEAAPLGDAGQHREYRGGAFQGLDLGFLVHAEDDGVPRRVQVDADDVADLVNEERVGGDLEGLGAPGLQSEGPPDVLHAARGDARLAGKLAFRPVRGAFGHFFQGAHHDVLDLGVGDGAGHARAGLVGQPVQAFFQEAAPPAGDRVAVDAEPGRDRDVVAAVGAGQHDPCPLGQALGRAPPLHPVLQRAPLVIRQQHRLQPRVSHAPSRTRPEPGEKPSGPGSDAKRLTWCH